LVYGKPEITASEFIYSNSEFCVLRLVGLAFFSAAVFGLPGQLYCRPAAFNPER